MKLEKGERSILAYFPSSNRAQDAASELKEQGYSGIQIDRVSRYGVSHDTEINNPIAGRAETGTGLTFYGANVGSFEDNDTRILQGADPSNSGYGDTNYGIAGGKAFLLTLVTSDDNVDKAVSIIKNHHGQV